MAAKSDLVAVTSTNKPYLYDCPNVLSLPEGTESRFRYRKEWVEPELHDQAAMSPKQLEGSRLILLFHSQKNGHLVPLREAKVVRVEVLGPITYVRFKVCKFLSPPQEDQGEGDWRLAQATEWGRRLLGLDSKVDLKKQLPEAHYFRSAGTVAEVVASAVAAPAKAWWDIVSLLGGDPALRRLPFFFVLGMQSEWGNRKRWWRLAQGGRYRLRVLEWSFRNEKEGGDPLAFVNCSSSPDLLVLEAAFNAVVGQYDVVDFDFVATKLGKGQLTISLNPFEERKDAIGEAGREVDDENEPKGQAATRTTEEDPRWSQAFHTAIPIWVLPSWWRVLLRFSLAIVGATLYGVGPVLAKGSPAAQNAAQVVGLLLFVVGMGKLGEKAVTAGKDVRDLANKREQGSL